MIGEQPMRKLDSRIGVLRYYAGKTFEVTKVLLVEK